MFFFGKLLLLCIEFRVRFVLFVDLSVFFFIMRVLLFVLIGWLLVIDSVCKLGM